MYCVQCGFEVRPDHVFCSQCGHRLADPAVPAAPAPAGSSRPAAITGQPSRVAKHLNVLAILWIVFSVLRLIPGLAMLVFSHTRFPFLLAPFPAHLHGILGPILGGIGFVVSAVAIAGVIAGWGLLTHQSWARVLTIIVGIISLIHFPLGTALGIYTLWVLFPPESEREYLRLASNN
jgi:type IV secretory pathway VirB2 component (pilin)